MDKNKKPKLSVIINHHRTVNILKMCLDSLKEKLKNIDYEVIVTDSETEDQTPAMLQQYHPDAIFIGNLQNIGFARGMNPAIKMARGQFIFMINADIITRHEDDIASMIKYMEDHPEVGIMGPRLFNIDGSIQQSCFRHYTPMTILARRTGFGKTAWGKKAVANFTYNGEKFTQPTAVEWVMGSAMMTERERFKKAGDYFDERFFMYLEDSDLCKRFELSGFKVIHNPQMEFTHYHIRESHGGRGFFDIFTNWLTRVHIQSYFKFLWKWRIESLWR